MDVKVLKNSSWTQQFIPDEKLNEKFDDIVEDNYDKEIVKTNFFRVNGVRLKNFINELTNLKNESTKYIIKFVGNCNLFLDDVTNEPFFLTLKQEIKDNIFGQQNFSCRECWSIYIPRGLNYKTQIRKGLTCDFYYDLIKKVIVKYRPKILYIFTDNKGNDDLKDLKIFKNIQFVYIEEKNQKMILQKLLESDNLIIANDMLMFLALYLTDNNIYVHSKIMGLDKNQIKKLPGSYKILSI